MASGYSWVYFEDKMEVVKDKLMEVQEFYNWTLSFSDPRVADWPLMDGISNTLALSGLYLLIVWCGPIYMHKRKPFVLKWPLFIYNITLIALNFYICFELLVGSYRAGYNYLCQPVTYSLDPNEMRIANAIWWFYVSKLIEMLDTVFFILRQKNEQITFLHVYHHVTMFPIWWIGTKWVAGGQSFLGALLNSSIHVMMYSYYGLSALGPAMQKYLWWKRYLTIVQLVQFVVGMIHATQSLLLSCNFPVWMHWALIFYGMSLLLLFLNFYYNSYVLKKRNRKKNGSSNSKKSLPKEANNSKKADNKQYSKDSVASRRKTHAKDQ
ncbi:elongation of very long chain fatty acids protein 4 isoform X1 [Octopus bimaculoides]|uniref:elongation of very long chain fatty acids protein 4 isoform X1 n=2 Tax=Octopus bimaculoides TaxID=37653 RepID=UPI00071D3623|nr:elongation of very long chain fatty acids protein 4 isoform X1 [Octopus bimaculoides]XP_014784233.1 elongation of very long chain fatty acids protein 4 isoform X1 [Octopus bimaculoides]|eukprot:XP_014784232.1 PREDICTED: elongation of very long chain fatty acids protein 4-like isoform X1 [Octopus bimaculoides]